MTSGAASIELCAASAPSMISTCNNSQQLRGTLHYFFFQRTRIDPSFAILPEFDFLLLKCPRTCTCRGSRQQIMDLLIVNFKVADSKKEFSMRSLADIGEYVGDGKRDDTGTCSGALHGKRFSRPCHTIGKDRTVITLHDSSDQTFSRRIVHLCVVIVRGKYVIYHSSVKIQRILH